MPISFEEKGKVERKKKGEKKKKKKKKITFICGIECPTFAPATIAPAVNPNVERNPSPQP